MAALDIISSLENMRILTPEDGDSYHTALQRWSDASVKQANYIVFPATAEDVSRTILFASSRGLEIAIKGGGHSCSGASSSLDVVIDLAYLNSVIVDTEKRLITVGGGALWEDVDNQAEKYGLAAVGGTVNSTGVGGLTVGGGYGFLSGKYGLVIDNLVKAEVVLANGEIVVCDEGERADLFWAIRGGGSNFGPVTSFVFKAHPQPNQVWSGLLIFTPDKIADLIIAAKKWFQGAGENEGANIFISCAPSEAKPTPVVVLLPFYNGSAEDGKDKFQAFYDVGPVADLTKEMPYKAVNTIQDPMTTRGDRKRFKATKFTSFSPTLFKNLLDTYSKLVQELPDTAGTAIIIELYPPGVIESVPSTKMAFANRGGGCSLLFVPRWKDAMLDEPMQKWSREQANYVREEESAYFSPVGSEDTQRKAIGDPGTTNSEQKRFQGSLAYANYGSGDESIQEVFGDNYKRLKDLKEKYDPKNVFHMWFPLINLPSK